jgi:thymidylate synthase (FAD)
MSEEQIKATFLDYMGTDISVVNAARVSFGKKSSTDEWGYADFDFVSGDMIPRLDEKDTKLIHYLAKHKHFSPFGHAFASFHVKAPIFVARQLVKHKFLRWNEISRRYVDDPPEMYTPSVLRNAPVGNVKQGSSGEHYDSNKFLNILEGVTYEAVVAYNMMILAGVAPEQARAVLPQSTMTEWYWSGSLDAFAQMCALRLKDDTQYESRLVAQQVSASMSKAFPVSWSALMENL